jgi:hypothetical protein
MVIEGTKEPDNPPSVDVILQGVHISIIGNVGQPSGELMALVRTFEAEGAGEPVERIEMIKMIPSLPHKPSDRPLILSDPHGSRTQILESRYRVESRWRIEGDVGAVSAVLVELEGADVIGCAPNARHIPNTPFVRGEWREGFRHFIDGCERMRSGIDA